MAPEGTSEFLDQPPPHQQGVSDQSIHQSHIKFLHLWSEDMSTHLLQVYTTDCQQCHFHTDFSTRLINRLPDRCERFD